jgi:hypothetical protein
MSNNDGEEKKPLLNPSDKWNKFTNSHMSEKHLNAKEKQIRTSGAV